MIEKIIVILKRVRQAMPKFYHGKALGFQYKARAIGWRRIPLLSLLPYLTSEEIQIHLSLKSLYEEQEWQQGTLQIEPPELSRDEPYIRLSDYVFIFSQSQWSDDLSISSPLKYRFPIGKWWSDTLPLRSYYQPCNIKCSLSFQNFVEETVPIRIAHFEVMGRDSFFMWLFGILIGITAIIASILAIILNILC